MVIRTCEYCGGDMPITARSHARYCAPACRAAAGRARKSSAVTLPKALTDQPRWIRRTPSKVPLTIVGRVASSTDSGTWSTFKEATQSSVGAGLGFVLNGDGVCCIDLDHCVLPDGSLTPAAAAFVAALPKTYIEISPSGDGLHIWGTGAYQTKKSRRADLPGEIIADKKYATVTGNRFRNAPLTLARIAVAARSLLT